MLTSAGADLLKAVDKASRVGILDQAIEKLHFSDVFTQYARDAKTVNLPDGTHGRLRKLPRPRSSGRWLTAGIILAVFMVAVALSVFAWKAIARAAPLSEFGKAALSLGIVGIGGTLIGLAMSNARDQRANQAIRVGQRKDLLVRTRACHLRIMEAQRVVDSDNTPTVIRRQMLKFMQVADTLEDIERDVIASNGLFGNDGDTIARGLRLVAAYLHARYHHFRHRTDGDAGATRSANPSRCTATSTGTDTSMPIEYEIGITLSKGVMRFYVYGKGDPLVAALIDA
jgi:hypothetical protein